MNEGQNMRHICTGILTVLVFFGLLSACSDTFHLTVLYSSIDGLRSGDRVLWADRTIGEVRSIETDSAGRFRVNLEIREVFAPELTDNCRFLIEAEPQKPELRRVHMIRLAGGGEPLAEGAMIDGSSSLSVLVERGGREVELWSKKFQVELERWRKEFGQLSEEQWYEQIKRQMEHFARELERSGKEARRYLRETVLPRLEEAVRELQRRLQEQDKGEEVEVLEVKLEELRRI
jgi:hypothetical protein